MAATYPLEVVEAARWLRQGDHASLRGAALEAALAERDWDPAVKSLVPFAQILDLLDGDIEWTRRLGDAFLSDRGAVMDAVQRLRAAARAAGTLTSTPQETVRIERQVIYIEPAGPDVVYLPYYDPMVVYGGWRWLDYPPVVLPRPSFVVAAGGGVFFGPAWTIARPYWGWHRFDWDRREVRINISLYDRIARPPRGIDRPPPRFEDGFWRHDPDHRRGVTYGDPETRARFDPEGLRAARTGPDPATAALGRGGRRHPAGNPARDRSTQWRSAQR